MRRMVLGVFLVMQVAGGATASGIWGTTGFLMVTLSKVTVAGGIRIWGEQYFDNTRYSSGTYQAISAGGWCSLALKTDGSMVGWGSDCGEDWFDWFYSGQSRIPSGNDYIAISSGGSHSLALKKDGSIVSWGQNWWGQANPPAGQDYLAISAGSFHSLALKRDGSIVGWGRNAYGELPPPAGNDYVAIAAGYAHSLALRKDGSLVGWGGIDPMTPPGGNDYVAIAAGALHSLALKTDGSVVCWGENWYGEASPPVGNDFVAIAAGEFFSLALKTDGSIVGWPEDSFGVVNLPTGHDYVAISAGNFHALALKADGSFVGWGNNTYGQSRPPSGEDFVDISAGWGFGLALKEDGTILSWGANWYGETSSPSGNDHIAISAGGWHGMALKRGGSVVVWGSDHVGMPPTGWDDYVAISAGEIHCIALRRNGTIVEWGNYGGDTPSGDDFVAVAAGSGHSLALKADGSIVNWGDSEMKPPLGNDYVAIAGGAWHCLALRKDGSIVGWPEDSFGVVNLPTGHDYVAIAAGGFQNLALKKDGSIMSWGQNSYGEADPPAGQDYLAIAAGKFWSYDFDEGRDFGSSILMALVGPAHVGRTLVESSSALSGLALYGDQRDQGMAGLPVLAHAAQEHVLCRYHSSARWTTGLVVANTDSSLTANVNLTAYDVARTTVASGSVTVPPNGKVSKDVSDPTLFGGLSGTGWIDLKSDVPVSCQMVYKDGIDGGLAMLSSSETGDVLYLPHFVRSSRWWTGISVVNPNQSQVNVTLTAYGNDGTVLNTRAGIMAAHGTLTGLVENLLGISSAAVGWIKVESQGGPVAGTVVYGDRGSTPEEIGAMTAVTPSNTVCLSNFTKAQGWSTQVVVLNPNASTPANVLLKARGQDGTLIGTVNQTVLPLHKMSGEAGSLFNLTGSGTGWVLAESDVPIVGFEILQADDSAGKGWGFAAIEGQEAGTQLYLPHYDARQRWWTGLALANPGNMPRTPSLTAYGNDGHFVALATPTLPAQGSIMMSVKALFGIP